MYSICIFYHIICRHIIFFLQHINSHTRINELPDDNTSKSRPGANQHQLPAFVPITSADTGRARTDPIDGWKKSGKKLLPKSLRQSEIMAAIRLRFPQCSIDWKFFGILLYRTIVLYGNIRHFFHYDDTVPRLLSIKTTFWDKFRHFDYTTIVPYDDIRRFLSTTVTRDNFSTLR